MVVNWKHIQEAYAVVKKGKLPRVDGENFKVYSMGKTNPVVRIDIKEAIKA